MLGYVKAITEESILRRKKSKMIFYYLIDCKEKCEKRNPIKSSYNFSAFTF